MDRIARQIIRTPAKTLVGMLVELRVNTATAVKADHMIDVLAKDLRAMRRRGIA
ncbi:hypothetical protein [Aureimonas sp. SA4125]|uniref:hypothetical protein n=1 Tax=Aureimonas sp. SA4125 TaxID=2826993 RepID=UPI001CC6E5B6|nr:hypothetical protein [Aureimonas sp. SA4125]